MSQLRAIAYASSATRLFTDSELEALLKEARALNEANGISGVLLYSDGNFMQYIEGPPDAVGATMQRIESSLRHKGVTILLDTTISSRSFPDWKMGFAEATESEMLAVSTARWEIDVEDSGSAQKSLGLTALRSFWENARR